MNKSLINFNQVWYLNALRLLSLGYVSRYPNNDLGMPYSFTLFMQNYEYSKSPIFFNTCILLLVTGCRINELPTIKLVKNNDYMQIQIDCSKQKTSRVFTITAQDADKYLPLLGSPGIRFMNEHEFNRRFKKLMPELHALGLMYRIHSGSHMMRHICACTLHHTLGLSNSEIRDFFEWKTLDVLHNYLVLLKAEE